MIFILDLEALVGSSDTLTFALASLRELVLDDGNELIVREPAERAERLFVALCLLPIICGLGRVGCCGKLALTAGVLLTALVSKPVIDLRSDRLILSEALSEVYGTDLGREPLARRVFVPSDLILLEGDSQLEVICWDSLP